MHDSRLATVRVEPAPAPGAEWDAYLDRVPDATLFHRSGWLRAVESTFGYRSRSCLARRGARVCGVLPLYQVPTLPRGTALVSTPLGVYGGICADDDEARWELLRHAQSVGEREGVRYIELRHRSPFGGLPAKDLYVTFRREIDRDHDKNMAAIPRNQRRSIRIAIKNQLRGAMGGAELIEPWYAIYSESLRHLGTPTFPKGLFRSLARELDGAFRILGIYHGEVMVAGVLTFLYRDEVLPYYGGALRSAFPLACNDYMYWHLMCWAADGGYRIFDFGRSKRESGSYHFKRHWGFEPAPLAYQVHLVRQRGMPDASPMNPRYSLAIRAWRRMPAGFARWLGPKVVRYFP